MCCGSKRAALRSEATLTPAPAASVSANVIPPDLGPARPGVAMISLSYADRAPIRLRGPVTGRAYSFSGSEPVQEVDVRDATIFLRTARLRLSVHNKDGT